ncbi:S8 family serine peptidase [Bradyrhizobium barranii]|uniref:S8 family serine peptidase n=1 Tax=Bradyrhizobium barranii TaxID=2992140 RepID=UPI001A9CA756|nr:S8 family serine peptidase [Bradyrhizobium barranii]
MRTLLSLQSGRFQTAGGRQVVVTPKQQKELEDLGRRVSLGREIDWDMLLPLITVPYDNYEPPSQEHGTHVAGILAGNWPDQDNDDNGPLVGICPELTLYDFRVFDQNGEAEEFVIMAAPPGGRASQSLSRQSGDPRRQPQPLDTA